MILLFLFTGVAGMMNWSVGIAPDVLKSRLQTGTVDSSSRT